MNDTKQENYFQEKNRLVWTNSYKNHNNDVVECNLIFYNSNEIIVLICSYFYLDVNHFKNYFSKLGLFYTKSFQ